MAAEENWQTKLQTIVERSAFIFNNAKHLCRVEKAKVRK